MCREDIERMVKLEEAQKKTTEALNNTNKTLGDLSKKVDNLPADLIKQMADFFDNRYASKDCVETVKDDLKSIHDTVDPLTVVRKRLWLIVITIVIGSILFDTVLLDGAKALLFKQ